MQLDVSDHIVICNWNERGERVVRELHHAEGKPEVDIVIVDSEILNERDIKRLPGSHRIYCVQKDPMQYGTLKIARVDMADTVIVLADYQRPDPDAKSAMIILALLGECKKRHPHIISEVVNSDNGQYLRDAGANETVCTTDIGVGILAHSVVNSQLSAVYEDLFTYTLEGNEIYIVPEESYPDSFVGKTFAECQQILNLDRNPQNPAILLGIRRRDEVLMNPRRHTWETDDGGCLIEKGDGLIVLAYFAPNLKVDLQG